MQACPTIYPLQQPYRSKGHNTLPLDQIVSRVLHEARQPKTVFNTRAGKGKSTKDHKAKDGKNTSKDEDVTCLLSYLSAPPND